MSAKPRVTGPATKTGNVIRDSAMGLVPETVSEIIKLNANVWNDSLVPPSLLEIIRLRNARTVNCVFCKSVRYDVARQDGLSEDRAELVVDGYEDSDLSSREKAALLLADSYLNFPTCVSDDDARQITSHYNQAEIASMLLSLLSFNFTSRMAVSIGGMPEDGTLPITEIPVISADS